MPEVSGFVADGFEPVRAAFEANFRDHGDLGAGVCVYRDGAPVVDLVGGVINIVLRPEADGTEVRTTYTNTLGGFTCACNSGCAAGAAGKGESPSSTSR